MTLVGFKSMTIRIHDGSDTIKENENLFKIQGDDSKGATQKVDIKGLAPEVVKGYGSNITYFASRSGVGNPIADYEILDLPFAVREILLGYKKVGKLTFIGDDTKAPYCSILLESEDLGGTPAYFGIFKGVFSSDDLGMETRKEKTDEPTPDKLTHHMMYGEKGDSKGQVVGYYIGKDDVEITKLKKELLMVPAG